MTNGLVATVYLVLVFAAIGFWNRARWLSLIFIAIMAFPFAGRAFYIIYPKLFAYSHRYRITLEVETPQGVKTGSSVIQVTYRKRASGGLDIRVKGEAIFLELGEGKNVVATLAFGPTGSDVSTINSLAAQALGHELPGFYKRAPSWEGRAELTGKLIPTLVTFADPADPTTLSVVPPDQFETVFGPGYRFKGMWLEMTKDEVTDIKIVEKLPWLFRMKDYIRPDSNGNIWTPFNTKFSYAFTPFYRGEHHNNPEHIGFNFK